MSRQQRIARSIVCAVVKTTETEKPSSNPLVLLLALFSTVFSLYQLALRKVRPADFANLRRKHWDVSDEAYAKSFRPVEDGHANEALKPIGDMGFSGSVRSPRGRYFFSGIPLTRVYSQTFYSTADQKYLVKSVPRHSEHSFFCDDLLTGYVEHMAARPRSLLVRICDFLSASGASLGRMLRLAPSHHIVMDNIMHGREEARRRGEADWEDWDLKPTSYFYPERDIAGGALTSDATKNQLADEFTDKIVLTRKQADDFFACLEADTKLLAEHNAVDYSLFLVRMRAAPEHAAAAESAAAPAANSTWRSGIASADGRYIFRACILDFFWAKHKAQPRLMTLLIKLWNVLVSNQGPMSITTTPDEYRERFVRMCRDIVEVKEV